MKIKNFINWIQTNTKATKAELLIVTLVLSGLFIGLIYKQVNEKEQNDQSIKNIYNYADSLIKIKNDTTHLYFNEDNDSLEKRTDHYVVKLEKNSTEKININKAPKIELMKVPGIGEKTAETILEYRKNKPFSKIEDLMKIKGIGDKKFEKMKKNISVN